MHLTAAYRSLSRPSSADIAKASAVRPYLLDLLFFLRFVKSLFFSKKRYFFVFYTVVKVRHKRKSGGDEENRTPDPLLARQVLSQLSYTPTDAWLPLIERGVSMQSGMARRLSVLYSVFRVYRFALVGLGGLEPPTSRLSGVRSNQLSYRPILWWRRGESNS